MDFYDKLKSKKIQVSKTEEYGYDLRQKWEAAFASHLSPKEKRQIFLHDKGGASGYLWQILEFSQARFNLIKRTVRIVICEILKKNT